MFAWYPRINRSWDLSLQNSSNPCMTAPAYLFRLFVSGLGVPSPVGRGMKGGLKGWELKERRRMGRNGNFWENIFYIVKLVPLLSKRCRPTNFPWISSNRSNFILRFSQIITWLIYCKFCNIWNSLLRDSGVVNILTIFRLCFLIF